MSPVRWPVIAFVGPAGCGKSTAAKAIERAHRFSFADPLKQMLLTMGVTHESLYDPVGKNQPIPWLGDKTGRELMQSLGTEWGRGMVHRDIWLRVGERKLLRLIEDGPVVIDDVRFANEAELLRSLGGVVIEIRRHNVSYGHHESEKGLPFELIDFTIANDCDAAEFANRVRARCLR